jgi:L-asparagine transporter-like permease
LIFSEQTPKYLIYNGIIVILLGVKLLFTPVIEFRTMEFNFTGYNVPTGVAFIALGIVFFYGFYRGKKNQEDNIKEEKP